MEKTRELAVVSDKIVFISWSGSVSGKVAEVIRKRITLFIPDITPFMSKEDIAKGSRGINEIEKSLTDTAYGIVILTKNNINAPWINYEAGAIAKGLGATKVAPLLCNLSVAELGSSPLSNFQAVSLDKKGLWDLFDTIRKSVSSVIDIEQLHEYFDAFYTDFIEEINVAISEGKVVPKTLTDDQKKIEGLARQISYIRSHINRPGRLLPESYLLPLLGKISSDGSLSKALSSEIEDLNSEKKDIVSSVDETVSAISDIKFDLDGLIDDLSQGENFEEEFSDELKELKRILAAIDEVEFELMFIS